MNKRQRNNSETNGMNDTNACQQNQKCSHNGNTRFTQHREQIQAWASKCTFLCCQVPLDRPIFPHDAKVDAHGLPHDKGSLSRHHLHNKTSCRYPFRVLSLRDIVVFLFSMYLSFAASSQSPFRLAVCSNFRLQQPLKLNKEVIEIQTLER